MATASQILAAQRDAPASTGPSRPAGKPASASNSAQRLSASLTVVAPDEVIQARRRLQRLQKLAETAFATCEARIGATAGNPALRL